MVIDMLSPSEEYINYICSLYGDTYDDRIENTCPPVAGDYPGEDWKPGQRAEHKSLSCFQKELAARGIKLSTSKIKKILITGGRWTTGRGREIQELHDSLRKKGISDADAIKQIAEKLHISPVSVSVNLPYSTVVYNLERKSSNAKRCARYKKRRKRNDVL